MLAQQTIPASKDALAAGGTICAPRLALDDVALADVGCQPDNSAIAVIAEHFAVPVEFEPDRHRGHGAPFTQRWFFLGVEHG